MSAMPLQSEVATMPMTPSSIATKRLTQSQAKGKAPMPSMLHELEEKE